MYYSHANFAYNFIHEVLYFILLCMLYIVFTFLGRASRYCDENSNWAEPNVLECESTEFREIRLEVLHWDQLSLVVSLIMQAYVYNSLALHAHAELQIRYLLQAERIFGSNATLEEVLAQAAALTARLNASTAVVTQTMQSLLPQDLNTSNSILSSTITALQDSMTTGFNTTTNEPQEVYQT